MGTVTRDAEMGSCLLSAFRGMRNPVAVHRVVSDEDGWPIDHVFVGVNDAFELLTGLEGEAIAGRSVRAVLTEQGLTDADWTAVYAVTADSVDSHFTGFFQQAGCWYQVDTHSPCPGYHVAVFTDLTDAVETLEAAQQSREYYEHLRELLDELAERGRLLDESQRAARVGSYSYDVARDRWQSSPVLEAILGVDAGHPRTAAGWLDLAPPEDRAELRAYLARLIETRGRFDRTYRIVRERDAEVRWVHGRGEFVDDEKGLRLVGTIQDVTGHHLAEEALRAYQRQLKALAVRQADLAQRERRALAVQLHDRVSTPLAAARIHAQLLGSNGGADGKAELVGLIEQAMQESRAITSALGPPLLYELGLLPALEWLGERFADDFGLRCEIVPSGDAPVDTDTAALAFRAVRELLANVAQHAGVDHATVLIEQTAGGLMVRVEDEGRGFAGEVTPGVGLVEVREAVEANGGTLRVCSAEGAGTAVSFRLPRR